VTGRSRFVIAALVGILVFAILFPWGGCLDSDPPHCYGLLGPLYEVPDGGWPAVVAGIITGAAASLLLDRFTGSSQPL
jgi:hypothetical protein